MDHDAIRNKLSAYLDGAVTPAEKSLIEKHLAECEECGKALGELQKTVQHLRDLGELEPPPWLTARIMARVREEAGREKGLLRRLLQAPLRWRVSVEAVALLFLCVTGYLVYRNVSSELPQIAPLSGLTREEPAPAAPPAAPPRTLPEEKPIPLEKKPPAAVTEKPGTGSVPLALPEEEPYAESRQEELEPPSPAPAEVPFRAENKAMPDFQMQERSAAKSLARQDEFLAQEKERQAASGMARSKSVPAGEPVMVRLYLAVADADAADHEIERATARNGGVILRRDVRSEGEAGLLVRLPGTALKGYVALLKKLGNMRGTVPVAPEGDDTVTLYLVVTTVR